MSAGRRTVALRHGPWVDHGRIASQAATAIVEAVRRAPANRTPVELVEAAHQAAKTHARRCSWHRCLGWTQGPVALRGHRQIAALIVNGTERRHLVSQNGITGHDYRKLAEFSQPCMSNRCCCCTATGSLRIGISTVIPAGHAIRASSPAFCTGTSSEAGTTPPWLWSATSLRRRSVSGVTMSNTIVRSRDQL